MGQTGRSGIITGGTREFPCNSLFDIVMLRRISGDKVRWPSFDAAPEAVRLRTHHEWGKTPIGRWTWALIEDRPQPRCKQPYFRTIEDWRAVRLPLIEQLDRPGSPVTRGRLVAFLRRHLPSTHSRNHESVEKFIYRMGTRFHCTIDDMMHEIRSRPKNF